MQINTLIISPKMLLRVGIKASLDGSQYEVIREASKISDVIEEKSDDAQLVVACADLVGETVGPINALKDAYPESRIVILTQNIDLTLKELADVLERNLDACLTDDTAPSVIMQTLDLVMLGERVFPFALITSMLSEQIGQKRGPDVSRPVVATFSARERQILEMLPRGLSNKFIARELQISEPTVKVHIRTLLRKIGAVNRTQAALWAARHAEMFHDEPK